MKLTLEVLLRVIQYLDLNQLSGQPHSRVVNDPFHLFNHFYIATGYELHIEFAWAMQDALFIPDEEDKCRITAWGQSQKPPQTFDNLV